MVDDEIICDVSKTISEASVVVEPLDACLGWDMAGMVSSFFHYPVIPGMSCILLMMMTMMMKACVMTVLPVQKPVPCYRTLHTHLGWD